MKQKNPKTLSEFISRIPEIVSNESSAHYNLSRMWKNATNKFREYGYYWTLPNNESLGKLNRRIKLKFELNFVTSEVSWKTSQLLSRWARIGRPLVEIMAQIMGKIICIPFRLFTAIDIDTY